MSNGERCPPCCGLSLCRRFFTRICGLSRQSRRLSLPHFGGLSRFFRKRGSSAHQFGLSLCCRLPFLTILPDCHSKADGKRHTKKTVITEIDWLWLFITSYLSSKTAINGVRRADSGHKSIVGGARRKSPLVSCRLEWTAYGLQWTGGINNFAPPTDSVPKQNNANN